MAKNILRDNGKKIMAIVSAILMIAFFLPSLRQQPSREDAVNKVVATVFGDTKITLLEQSSAKADWDMLRHLDFVTRGGPDAPQGEEVPLNTILDATSWSDIDADPSLFLFLARQDSEQHVGVVSLIDTNPETFLLLIKEAQHLGIGVSNDLFQTTIKSRIPNFPDEADPAGPENYDRALEAVHNVLLVRNLLDRVSDAVKTSDPRQLLNLAKTQQVVSLNVVEFPEIKYVPATTQPTNEDVNSQYDHYKQIMSDQPDATNPLGFGYLLPDRVKAQYIGFTMAEITQSVKQAQPMIEWQTRARRWYRTHTSDFPVPATLPSTLANFPSTQASPTPGGTPAWEDIPADVATKVYDKVYGNASLEMANKVMDHLTQQMAADWLAYHNAVGSGAAAPATAFGVPFNSDDYLQHLNDTVAKEFNIRPVLGIDNGGFKSAKELATLSNIGPAYMANGAPFAAYATQAGDQFKVSASLPGSARLSVWQPSEPVYTGPQSDPDGRYLFRLAAMDPSHTAPLADVRDQVTQDVRTQKAWNAALADADKLKDAAKTAGLQSAAMSDAPPLPVTTTDYFNPAQTSDRIPGLALQAASVKLLAQASVDLLTKTSPQNQKPVAEVQLAADRQVLVVELKDAHAQWQNTTDRQQRQIQLAEETQFQTDHLLDMEWSVFDNAVKRTGYQEAPKEK